MYYHKKRKLLLVVYVDDFKLAGPKAELPWAWKELSKSIQIDPPSPPLGDNDEELRVHRYLGCGHEMQSLRADSLLADKLLSEIASVRLAAPDEAMSEADNQPRTSPSKPALGHINVKDSVSAALAGACEKYLKVAPRGTDKKATTPFINEALLLDGQEPSEMQKGTLAAEASSILMSLLYTARYARYDLLRLVCALASMVSRWNVHCDRML